MLWCIDTAAAASAFPDGMLRMSVDIQQGKTMAEVTS
jgi:hypothetical protein